ncbi:putative T7SS-secreted protein [Actinopolyspora sp. H202]|uniref:putative T7SS-secreted protein n=1 Tax=Actinopolyspora sp. H202 TaxID=1500456 RepID=UPI003EE6B63B
MSNQSSIGQDAVWLAGNLDDAVEWVPGGGETTADWLRSQRQGPIPGEPATLRETADHLSTLGKACERAGEGFRAIDDGGWYGKAADGFHAYLDQAAPKWFRAADALTEAGKAVTDYAETLESAQRRAHRAQQDLESAEQRTEQARQRHNAEVENYNAQVRRANGGGPAPDMARPGEFVDPAADDKRAAKETIEQAKTEVNAAGDRAAGSLKRACADAPDEPGVLARWRDNMVDSFQASTDLIQDFGGGVLSGTAEMLKGIRMINPVDPYNLTHPASYGENLFTMGKGVVGAVTHPYQAVKTTLNVEGWQNNPAQALGKSVPSALASLAGGSGAAAKLSSMAGKFGRFGDELAGLGKRASDLPSTVKRAKPDEADAGASSPSKDGSGGSQQRPSQPSHPGQHQQNQPNQPSNQGQQPGGHGQSAGNPTPPQQHPAQPNVPQPEVSSSTPPWANQDLPPQPAQPPQPEPPSPGSGGFGDPAGQHAGTHPFGPGSAPQQDFGPGPRPDGGFGPQPDGGSSPESHGSFGAREAESVSRSEPGSREGIQGEKSATHREVSGGSDDVRSRGESDREDENSDVAKRPGNDVDELEGSRIAEDISHTAIDPVDPAQLPDNTVWRQSNELLYRVDDRSDVFDNGFEARDTRNLDLDDYVENNTESGYVSWSRDKDIWLQFADRKYVYVTDAPGGIDVNASVPGHQYQAQEEIAHVGGTSPERIVGRYEIIKDPESGLPVRSDVFEPNPNYSPLRGNNE